MSAEPPARLKYRLLGAAISAITRIGGSLPLRAGCFAGRLLGTIGFYVAARERRMSLRHLGIAFPEMSAAARRHIAKASFSHLGQCAFEVAWLSRHSAEEVLALTDYEGIEQLQQYGDAGRSVVVITGHCGNWEWLACGVGATGRRVTVMQRERDEANAGAVIVTTRARYGIHTIDRGSPAATRELMQGMRRGGALAFLIDQNIRAESAKVPFFGAPALTPIGPAKLAIRAGAVVMTAFVERCGARHFIRFHPAIETKRGDDPIALTARLTADIEAQIRRAPEQWVWMHERWRERPQWDVSERAD